MNFERHVIDYYVGGPQAVEAADIDLDGDIDVIGGAFAADRMTWWKNTLVNTPLNASRPDQFDYVNNYPNPFNSRMFIEFSLSADQDVSVYIYDILGRQIGIFLDGYMDAGTHVITSDASNHSSGVYFYRLPAGEHSEIRKMVLLK